MRSFGVYTQEWTSGCHRKGLNAEPAPRPRGHPPTAPPAAFSPLLGSGSPPRTPARLPSPAAWVPATRGLVHRPLGHRPQCWRRGAGLVPGARVHHPCTRRCPGLHLRGRPVGPRLGFPAPDPQTADPASPGALPAPRCPTPRRGVPLDSPCSSHSRDEPWTSPHLSASLLFCDQAPKFLPPGVARSQLAGLMAGPALAKPCAHPVIHLVPMPTRVTNTLPIAPLPQDKQFLAGPPPLPSYPDPS